MGDMIAKLLEKLRVASKELADLRAAEMTRMELKLKDKSDQVKDLQRQVDDARAKRDRKHSKDQPRFPSWL